ncbi:GtrA family protein [Actinocorallia sp. B10E7]|uniref:GtrA family protein n=1 Tax=Actinocorallia sp. B10E7 TaxID=3153558 RepID=UPI00325C788E
MNLRTRVRRIARELAKFGSVGAIAFVITFAAFNLFKVGMGVGPMTSYTIATVIATTFAYFANRYWTFRHRERSGLRREYTLFFALNGVGLVISQVFIWFGYYVLDQTSAIGTNLAMIVGTGAATVFRFWAYRKWVFLPPAPVIQVVSPQATAAQPVQPAVPAPVMPARQRRRPQAGASASGGIRQGR